MVVRKKKSVSKSKSVNFVIVRSHTAGVHAGELVSRKGDTVVLKNAIRLWRWMGASLSQVAAEGPPAGDNKFGMEVPKTEIVSPQGFEITTCTKAAMEKIRGVPKWKA